MLEKITVPTLGESVTEATVSKWLKSQGDKVVADEPIVELETDKVNVEVPAPSLSRSDRRLRHRIEHVFARPEIGRSHSEHRFAAAGSGSGVAGPVSP